MNQRQVQIQSLLLIFMVGLGILSEQSEAFIKRYRRCVQNCVIDCACIHPIVVTGYCPPVCLAKCSKCLFKKCDPITLPPPPYHCGNTGEKLVPEAYYFCIQGCTSFLDDSLICKDSSDKAKARFISCSKACNKKYLPSSN